MCAVSPFSPWDRREQGRDWISSFESSISWKSLGYRAGKSRVWFYVIASACQTFGTREGAYCVADAKVVCIRWRSHGKILSLFYLSNFYLVTDRPRGWLTQTVPISYLPASKPPIPHLNTRCLTLYPKHWHLLGIRHSGGLCGARCIFCTHFGREKVYFWACPDRPLLQDISIINVI